MKLKWPMPETFALMWVAAFCVFLGLNATFSWHADFGWKFMIAAVFLPIYFGYKRIYIDRMNDRSER